MHEHEVVFGGEQSCGMLEILKNHSPERVYVLNGCPSDMIHDDIQVCNRCGLPVSVKCITPGYCEARARVMLMPCFSRNLPNGFEVR